MSAHRGEADSTRPVALGLLLAQSGHKDAMSAIQIVCAVAVPLLWGYQFVAIKVGVMEFPPLFSSSRCASWPSRCCLFRSSKGPHVNSSALSQLFRFFLVDSTSGSSMLALGSAREACRPSHINSPRPSPSC
jgi:hypothetical protein